MRNVKKFFTRFLQSFSLVSLDWLLSGENDCHPMTVGPWWYDRSNCDRFIRGGLHFQSRVFVLFISAIFSQGLAFRIQLLRQRRGRGILVFSCTSLVGYFWVTCFTVVTNVYCYQLAPPWWSPVAWWMTPLHSLTPPSRHSTANPVGTVMPLYLHLLCTVTQLEWGTSDVVIPTANSPSTRNTLLFLFFSLLFFLSFILSSSSLSIHLSNSFK